MFRSITRFLANKRGAFAMQFALMAIPLTVCTGLAIDGGRAFLARFELSSALDAAALAVGSTLQDGADLDAIAAKFVERNFRTDHDNPIDLELVRGEEQTLILRGSVTINTYFMPLVGQPYVTVSAESQVRQGGSNVEVALALDITGSMNATRIAGLRSAANILVEEVVGTMQPPQVPFFSKVAIVPWSQAINLDTAGPPPVSFVPNTALTELRGTTKGTRPVSAASWRSAGTTTKTIDEAGWRTTTGARTIASSSNAGVDWRWGSSVAIASFAKVSSSTRIQVTTSNNHNYSDGQFVRITGAGGSYTSLNNNIYMVADKANKTFNLKNVAGTAYITPPSGSTSSTAASQRCYDSVCNIGVTTTAAFTGLSAGDFVNITGVSGFPSSQNPSSINNSATTTWVVSQVMTATNTFTLDNWNGPNFGSMSSGGGTVSECLVSDCRYRVTTSSAHGFIGADYVAIWGLTETGSGTSANSALNTTWSVQNPASSVFYLPGNGKTYKDWSSGGSAAKCQLSTCNTRITVSSHGLAVGDSLELKSVGGLTGLNNPTTAVSSPVSYPSRVLWKVSDVNGNVLTLADSSPAMTNMANAYTSGGTMQCLAYGCAKLGFLASGGDVNNPSDYRVWLPSPCIVERYGDNAYNDVSPATSPLSINYTSNGTCTRTNYITPLTANKDRLKTQIANMQVGGNTAGQLGIAWAWYMLSPNFASVWDAEEENKPLAYDEPELAKVAILMTDGEFNTQTCNGIFRAGDCSPDNPSDVPGPSASFRQARKICDAMKAQDIIIYTVGLQLNTAQYSDDFLLACATSPQHAFLAANNAELENAFKDIAISISRLRISK